MSNSKEELSKMINLDVVAGFAKLMSIAYILIIIINLATQPEVWYLVIPIEITLILIYKIRANFIRNKFKAYRVVTAKITKMNAIFIQGTRKITYSYEYQSKEYIGNSIILDFLRDSFCVKPGNLISIAVAIDNPQISKILELY
ncbi:hypothetical protein J2Z44_004019 [Clostridium punense]|uniref:DUF304 domain-containing protein n=1 Tax=Clostridium punense TaxID=1054297 RepID=A0ABS4K8P9_9CLOT|nr:MULTISPECIES: hypothetical protein [Clostridium]EQB89999.1 hypothetical protein M918_02330 [Clostridium sp. BL8]MBP2024164.1 hypothetical protein [Clostridium punense]